MLFVNAAVGLVQLVLAVILAVVALYIGFSVLTRITKGIDEEKELAKGNVAVGIIVASVFFAIAFVVQAGVTGVSTGLSKALGVGILTLDGLLIVSAAVFQLIIGIALAIGAIYLALNVLDKLTKGIEEFEEIRKGNVAVAVMMGGVIISVAVIIQSGVVGITNALL